MLEKNRQKRPSLEEVLKHEWFNSFKEIIAERKGNVKDENGLDSKFQAFTIMEPNYSKMVEDQKLIIGKLQLQLSTQYEKEIENLKKDIEYLNVANNEREMSIKSITKSLNELEEKFDDTDSDDYEDINEDEPFYSSYVDKALALVDETKDEIEKMRKTFYGRNRRFWDTRYQIEKREERK